MMSKHKVQDDLSFINFTLRYGQFYGESRKKIVVPYIILVIFSTVMSVFAVTMMSIEYSQNKTSFADFLVSIIVIPLAFFVINFILFIIVSRNEKIRKEVLLWLDDSIKLNAYCTGIRYSNWGGAPMYKLQIEFDIDGVHYIRSTENECRSLIDLGRPVGYFPRVGKYVNKEINILYSPKYDQVMILKN